MSYVLSEPYAELYNEYTEYERTNLCSRSFDRVERMNLIMFRWFEQKEILPQEIKILQATEFVNDIAKRVNRDGKFISQATICNYIKNARRFYKYLLEKEMVQTNPFIEVEYPRIPEHISRNVLTESQMNRLLEKLKCFDEAETKKERVRLYVCHVLAELMYSSGLRIEEAAELKEEDINFRLRYVYVRNGKGGKFRISFLTEYAAEILKLYIEKGKRNYDMIIYGKNRNTLFSAKGNILIQMLNKRLRKTCIELEIPVITSHGFRHSLGTHLLRSGCDMRHIQVILGHDKLSSTQIYTKVYSEDLKNSIDKYHPRKWIRSGDNKDEK